MDLKLTYKGVNQRSKAVTQIQQKPESLTVNLTWHASKYKVHKFHQRYIRILGSKIGLFSKHGA